MPAKPACQSSVIGAIKVHDDYSLVEVPDDLAEKIVDALKATKIRGNKVTIQVKAGAIRLARQQPAANLRAASFVYIH